jgi:hypothetical protein
VKKPRRYVKSKAVKALARERIGSPKPARIFDEKSPNSKPKHQKKVTEED